MIGEAESEIVRGTLRKVTFRNSQGFGVARVELSDPQSLNLETLVGEIPETLSAGESFVARGRWQQHPKFGRQFKAYSVVESPPTSAEALLRYLSSGAIKGVGPVLAQRIVWTFGEETGHVLDEAPQRLREVPGIGEKKLDEIISAWNEKKKSRSVLLYFQNYGIGSGLAERIYKAYGDRAIEIVSQNPYLLCDDLWGIGFLTADRIAISLGVALSSSQRIRAALRYVLNLASEDGHTYLPEDVLVAKTAKTIQLEENELIRNQISQGISEHQIEREGEKLYAPRLLEAEETLAERLAFLAKQKSTVVPQELIEDTCAKSFSPSGLEASAIYLSPGQREAIDLAATRQLLVITGGPGCGKTTVVRAISSLFARAGLSVKLAAPTGRAAQRLAEVCGMEASTIHRLLKYDPATRDFFHNEYNLLELDVIIVDESSMIDVLLAASLFRAIPAHAHVVVVGDADQLPSVGPGLFLADLLAVDEVPRVRLTTLFRRAEQSLITTIAHQVNLGEVPNIPEPDGITKTDAYFVKGPEPQSAGDLVERLVIETIPKKFGFKGQEITVLSPMNQGDLGVISLNKRLQSRFISSAPVAVKVGDIELHLGDRVCHRVNNYTIAPGGVFNGDQGEVIGVDAENQKIYVRLWDGREIEYGAETLAQLDLAYALSIHRSQGSEVPVIVLVLHDSHTIMLERQLLYTAITRAKRLLVIVGTRRALILAVRKTRSRRRFSGLADRIKGILSTSLPD